MRVLLIFGVVQVVLPGYDPHLSRVQVRSGVLLSMGGYETDITEVEMEDGVGIARIRAKNFLGTFEVNYWPDYVGQPEMKITESKL